MIHVIRESVHDYERAVRTGGDVALREAYRKRRIQDRPAPRSD